MPEGLLHWLEFHLDSWLVSQQWDKVIDGKYKYQSTDVDTHPKYKIQNCFGTK